MKFLSMILGLFLLSSCGSGGGADGESVFYDSASKVLPSIKTTSTSSSAVEINVLSNVCDTATDGVVSTVCDTFEAYTEDNWNNEEATLGHTVSMTNFYKFIIQTDAYISDGTGKTCEDVNDKVKLRYDDGSAFWTSTDTYKCKASDTEGTDRFKSYAWDIENNKYAVLYDHQDDSDEAMTYGSMTETDFNLTVKSFWSNPGNYRKFMGNTTEHSFTMEDVSGSEPTILVLAGYAQGLAKHFLAKNNDTVNTRYYCFTIDAQDTVTTSSGKTITVVTGLSVSDALTTCTISDCGGCESDTITLNGTLTSLPEAVDSIMTDIGAATGYQPTQHFMHAFEAI